MITRLSPIEARLAGIVVCVYLALTVTLSVTLNLSADEGASLAATSGTVVDSVEQAVRFEQQPPFYFAALQIWRSVFGSGILEARLLSVVCVLASLIAAREVSCRYLPTIHPLRLPAILAFHPFVIWCAVEIRVYGMLLLITALQMLTFYDGFLACDERPGRTSFSPWRSKVAYCVLAICGLYTQYYTGFFLVAAASVLFMQSRWRALGAYMTAMIVAGVCFLPMALVVPGQVGEHTADVGVSTSIVDAVKHIVWRIEHFLLPLSWEAPVGLHDWATVLWRVIPCVVVGGLVWKFRDFTFWRQNTAVWCLTAALAAVFVAVCCLVRLDHVAERHTISLFLPAFVTSFAIAASFAGNRGVAWWSALILCFAIPTLVGTYQFGAKRGDWLRIASYLESQQADDEPLVVFQPYEAIAFGYHYARDEDMIVVPSREDFVAYDMREYALQDERQLDDALDNASPDSNVVWLLLAGERRFRGVDFRWEVMDQWVSSRFTVEEEIQFYGPRLLRLRRRSES